MGRKMYTRHASDETDEPDGLSHVLPSCIWRFGFLNSIDYHHWPFNLKKMLLQKLNPRKRSKGKRREKELDQDVGEMQKLLVEDERCFHSPKQPGTKQKKPLKDRIKSLIAEEISEDNQTSSSFSSQPKLKRTYAIHHLEPLNEVCSDWEQPIIFFPNSKDTGAKTLFDAKRMNTKDKPDPRQKKSMYMENKNASKDKVNEGADILQTFKVNKDFFQEIIHDTDGGLRKFSPTLTGLKATARLTKSGSYPAPRLLQKRHLEPMTLKQKQNEIWSAPKGDKLTPQVEKLKYSKHRCSKSLPSVYSRRGSQLSQALNFILETRTESDERDGEVHKHYIETQKSVQSEVTEGGYGCSLAEEGPAKRSGQTAAAGVNEINPFSSHDTEEHYFSRNARSHRRSTSLNESLDKYARLFGNDLGKEVNLPPSSSLKLRNEYEMGLGGNVPILLGRIPSLSHLESFSILNRMHDVTPQEDWPIATAEESSTYANDICQDESKNGGTEEDVPTWDIPTEEVEILEDIDNGNQMANLTGLRENSTAECVAMVEDRIEEADPLMGDKSDPFWEKESISSPIDPSEYAQPRPVPAVETYTEEKISSSSMESQIAEDLDNRCDHLDADSSINYEESYYEAPSSLPSRMPNLENEDNMTGADLDGSYRKHDTDLDYVKDILDYAGFSKDVLQKTWHSSGQPLGPSVFDDMEAYWYKESEWSGEDYFGGYHHQLLFDIINEKLLSIHDRSSTYYPKALSSQCYIRPFPIGDRIVDEICASISKLTSLRPEQKQSLECMVGLDMGKDDGWMNLQLESECLVLELEDMIFDEFMEELEDMIFEQVFGS